MESQSYHRQKRICMKITKPKFKICTPNKIKKVFKTDKKEFSKRLLELLGTDKASSFRLKGLDMDHGGFS